MNKKEIGIWAQTKNGVIGKDQVMPWHLPAELRHFKETTMGQAILMGRVTYEGLNKRVLPNRINIVLSRDPFYNVENDQVLVFSSIEQVLDWYKQQSNSLFIIGGEKVIRLFEPYLEELYHVSLKNNSEVVIGSYKQFNEEDTKYYIHIFDYREENYINKELIEKISLLERKGLEFQPTWEVYSIEGYLKM